MKIVSIRWTLMVAFLIVVNLVAQVLSREHEVGQEETGGQDSTAVDRPGPVPFTGALKPPPTRIEPVVEVLHGVKVADPYRWLEDQQSEETRQWLDAQATYTRSVLGAIPYREELKKRLAQLSRTDVAWFQWSGAIANSCTRERLVRSPSQCI